MKHTIAFVIALVFVGSSVAPLCRDVVGCDDRPGSRIETKNGLRIYKGRVIAPVMTAGGGGAEWLERPDRDETEQPDRVIDALKIAPGSLVADVGAGTGYFSLRIARKIAPEGRVLATDLQPEMLRQLNENMKRASIKNIDRILATPVDTKLPPGKLDLALMVDVYHELHDPERTMAQVRKALKDDGRFVLVEYRAEDPDVPIKPEHKTTLRQIRYEIEPMGFRLKDVFEFLPHQHIEVFVKDSVQGEEPIVDPSRFPMVQKPGWAGVGTHEPYREGGFESLFDGKTLDGWQSDDTKCRVQGGAIICRGEGQILLKQRVPAHFELDLQWRLLDERASAGVCVGSDTELCVRLDSGVPYRPGYPEAIALRQTGEVSAGRNKVVQPATDLAKALVLPGEWNRLTIRQTGSQISIAINGVQTSQSECEPSGDSMVKLRSLKGEVEFREIWIRQVD
jgi:SAM-dependent methyltransferase